MKNKIGCLYLKKGGVGDDDIKCEIKAWEKCCV